MNAVHGRSEPSLRKPPDNPLPLLEAVGKGWTEKSDFSVSEEAVMAAVVGERTRN